MTEEPDEHRAGPPREEGRCGLVTCGVVIPYELTIDAGGPGYCCTEHEREGIQ